MRRMVATLLVVLLALGAREGRANEDAPRQLATVEVVGSQPGPGLWRVRHGDHELWILGTLSPVPKRMQWDASEVEATIRTSQQVLLAPAIDVETKLNLFARIALVPKILALRQNPGKQPLAEVLTPETYARWRSVASRYFRSLRSFERRRPIVVAQELFEEAIDEAGLRADSGVRDRVVAIAKRARVPIVAPKVVVVVADVKGLLREFEDTSLDDVACLEKTLIHVEQDLETMRLRANAWAIGDVEALRALTYTDSYDACLRSLFDAPSLVKYGFANLRERAREAWLAAAETALATHRSTFALLPMAQLLRDDGYVAELRRRGYRVEAPGEESEEPPTLDDARP